MALKDTLLPEFDQEMAVTRTELERVPEKDAAWRPHPKSFPLGDLAQHVANIPGWVCPIFAGPDFDLNPPGGPPHAPRKFTTLADLLSAFDENVAQARGTIAAATDEAAAGSWSLKHSGKAVFTLPRAVALRSFVMSHLIHHRAQLGVYLRMRDVPLPMVYGPSADTRPKP